MIAALAANLAIMVTKFIAAALSGSTALFAEGVHSIVDSGDSGLILLGLALSKRPASRQHPYRVPAGEFYVLGDNRADSCDSRYWGPIQGSSIVGKAIVIFWHDSHPEFHGL